MYTGKLIAYRIKIFPSGDGTGQYPHHSLSCNIISGAQMIIIGGTFPLTTQCRFTLFQNMRSV